MKKINIAELLKDHPSGMELYSPLCGVCEYAGIEKRYNDKYVRIITRTEKGTEIWFNEYGKYFNDFTIDECLLFPSKENRDWSTFQRPFKDGDIIVSEKGDIHLLRTSDSSYCAFREKWRNKLDRSVTTGVHVTRFATEEEKQKLFDAIKANGYKWNAETKTLEELIKPKFKVGDRIKHRLTGDVYKVLFVLSNGCSGGVYDVAITNEIGKSIDIEEQDSYELLPTKFDVTTLKPFDKVLVRNTNGYWHGQFYMTYDKNGDYPFECTYNCWMQCIPYEGNEHLLGTTNDCDDYFKTWE